MTPILVGTLLTLAFLLAVVGGRSVYRRAFGWHGWWGFWYRRYLRSEAWKDLRHEAVARDHWRCRDCGERADASEVHHLPGTYRGWLFYAAAPLLGLRENLANLVTLCRECHEATHRRGDPARGL